MTVTHPWDLPQRVPKSESLDDTFCSGELGKGAKWPTYKIRGFGGQNFVSRLPLTPSSIDHSCPEPLEAPPKCRVPSNTWEMEGKEKK